MYCLSNMPVETYHFIQDRPFFDYFEGYVMAGWVKMMKPEPEIFTYTLNKFGLSPEQTVFIDDSAANIAVAEKMGIHTVHFKRTAACYRQIRAFVYG